MRPMNPQVWIETLILLFMSASCIVFGLRAIMAGFRLELEGKNIDMLIVKSIVFMFISMILSFVAAKIMSGY